VQKRLLRFHVSDSTTPVLRAHYKSDSFVTDVAILGSHAFVAAGISGVQIVDISNPANPCASADLIPQEPLQDSRQPGIMFMSRMQPRDCRSSTSARWRIP